MMYAIAYEDRGDYLYVHMEGPESISAAIQFWEDLSEKAKEEGLERFLIVDEVTGKLSEMEIFELSVRISCLFPGAKIAYVDPKEETFELNKFGGLVVMNRGVLARVFRTEKEAVVWLKEDEPTP
jgi:hypothetical protein